MARWNGAGTSAISSSNSSREHSVINQVPDVKAQAPCHHVHFCCVRGVGGLSWARYSAPRWADVSYPTVVSSIPNAAWRNGRLHLPTLNSRFILGTRIDSTSYFDATTRVLAWARAPESRYVCVSNVHVTMESYDSPEYRAIVNGADLVTPDGMPLVWALRLFGVAGPTRVYGPTLTVHVLERAAKDGVAVGFYGSSPEVMDRMLEACRNRFAGLHVTYAHSPPFRKLTTEEDAAVVRDINSSGTRILFVGLGCPKQERWMASHKGSIHAVMLGVGAAFDFIAGVKPQAPAWMQSVGLEWLFRLATEPRRLWRRYAYHNPRFVALLAGQYLKSSIS
jgi:N-acetylglucosaminyldiphosphoundecaprenol N-acetyl-beta-D-mannosaminyltransferase